MKFRSATVIAASMLASAALASLSAAAAPIAAGASQQTVQVGGKDTAVFLYRPACSEPSLLVVLHGVGRNADGYRNHARPLADKLCMIVLAPTFDRKTFPSWRYQYGGIMRKGAAQPPNTWTGHLVLQLVAWARREEGKALPYSLIGHSAGGQFLERVAAFVPTEARRIVIANPSTYVVAALDVRAPYGLGGVYPKEKAEAELRRYLAAPVTVFLGEEDVGDEDLTQTPEAKAQGKTRHERGLNAFNAATKTAQAKGLPFNWRLVELPGVGHSARKMFASPQALEALAP